MYADEIKQLISKLGIDELNRYQLKVVDDGFLETGNHVISLPMGSGKSLLAYIKFLISEGQHFYIAPTRAIANQKNGDLQKIFDNVSMILGGHHSSDIIKSDIVITTPEKFVFLLRKNHILIDNIGVVVFDEAHLIAGKNRGSTYELLITLLKMIESKKIQIILMSGTIYNYDKLAQWLNGYTYHIPEPDDLREHYIASKNGIKVELINPETDTIMHSIPLSIEYSVETDILLYFYQETNKRVLVLCKTKSETEDLCKELRKITNGKDIYYHHRGLDNTKKKMVEQKCMNDDFRVIVSTTTFAMGIDYAFDMVVLTFAKLFDKVYSWEEIQPIDVSMILTLHQISRRSGHKPGLKSVSIALGEDYEESLLIYDYIYNKFPPISSMLYLNRSLMKMQEWFVHLISMGLVNTLCDLIHFVNNTFHISSGEDMDYLYPNIRDFLLNPWIELTSNEVEIDRLNIDDLLEYEILQPHIKIQVSECLVQLTEKGWSPKIIDYFVWHTYELFREDSLDEVDIIKYLIKSDIDLVVEMRKMAVFKHVNRSWHDKEYFFFDSLLVIDILWTNNRFSRLKNNDRKIWRRIVDLVELTKKCMSSEVCNTFFDEDVTDEDFIQMTLNEFKLDMNNKLLIQNSVHNVYEKIRID